MGESSTPPTALESSFSGINPTDSSRGVAGDVLLRAGDGLRSLVHLGDGHPGDPLPALMSMTVWLSFNGMP